ncbi:MULTISPECIES: tetratricopeptide repeat protein [unclassified Streptomyces]|uniref:tetratricopeptide repeat protein n=1 Tax=unclassified Streptomyces TaxID=2593676 RepID=UPI002E28717E|nr:tetratricopeptide repeat protein [Streptomyces sp. NBC_01423]
MTNAADMMADLARRLASGESPEDISRSLVPECWRPALRACAAARMFDSALYERTLRPWAHRATGEEPPSWSDLVEQGAVIPARWQHGQYALTDSDRSSYFREWLKPTPSGLLAELEELEKDVARYWGAAGDEVEQLRHLLLGAPERAVSLFDRLFAQADEDGDFAACEDLVDVLGDPDRSVCLAPELRQRYRDCSGYVRTRSFWAADYARAAQYLPPDGIEEQAERLLRGEQRIWQMYAPGGAGKTMQLRWLVARHWVPAGRDVLCARIDFDFASARAVGRHPWLILLEIAEQVGRRFPGNLFERLESYAAYRVLLDRRPSKLASDMARDIALLNSEAVEDELVGAFADRLNRVRPGKPVVLVVDTLEELLLHGSAEAAQLLRLLARLLDRCPGLRVILAGRYDLREAVPDALTVFGDVEIAHVEVPLFTSGKTRAYLARRGITDPELVHAATSKAQGLPFTLALCADVIESDPDITPETLNSWGEPHLRYLIERVVCRIEDSQVRWILRYGVIPRQLRFEDVKQVMLPWLSAGISGAEEVDDPRTDAHHLRGSSEVFPVLSDQLTGWQLENAWQRLLDYAGASSWVSRQPGDDSVVVFHPNVAAPMRQLVALQPVAGKLHRAFARHFESQAGADPEQWLTYTREALYHYFQGGHPDAVQAWHNAVRRADERNDFDGMRELAEEVLGPEYVEGTEPRRLPDGPQLISHTTLIAAHLVIATSLVLKQAEENTYNAADPLWNEIEHRMAVIGKLRAKAPAPDVQSNSAEQLLRACLLSSQNKHQEAAHIVQEALRVEEEDRWRERLQVTLARIQTALHDGEAESTYRSALHTAHTRSATASQWLISLELAQQLERQGNITKAVELEDQVVTPDESKASAALTRNAGRHHERTSPLQSRAMLAKARSQLNSFVPTEALATLQRPELLAVPHAQRVERCLLQSRAHRLLGQSQEALAALDEAEQSSASGEGPARFRHLARSLMARAAIEGEMLAVDRAQSLFDRAAGLWSDLGFPHGHPRYLLLYARFLARDLQDLRRAAAVLVQLQTADASGGWAVERALLWHQLSGLGYPVHDVSLLDVPADSRENVLRGGVAAVLNSPQRTTELCLALATVQPPSARLGALAGLSSCPTPPDEAPSPSHLNALHALFAPIAQPARSGLDYQVQLTHLAHLGRLGGQRAQAAHLSDRAHQELHTRSGDPLSAWRRAQAQMLARGTATKHVSDSLLEVAPATAPLSSAVARWFLAQRASAPAEERDEHLRRAVADLGGVHQESAWEARILHSVGEDLNDGSMMKAADRMMVRLGHPAPGEQARSPLDDQERPETDRVFSIVPGSTSTAGHQALADTLLADWRAAAEAMLPRLREVWPGTDQVSRMQVRSDDAALHTFPWELSSLATGEDEHMVLYRTLPDAAESADVRALQSALRLMAGMEIIADGVLGGATFAAAAAALNIVLPKGMSGTSRALVSFAGAALVTLLREARKRTRARFGAHSVLLLESAPNDALLDLQVPARSLTDVYRSQGCEVLQVSSPASLPPARRGAPAVLHVHAPLRIKGGTTPYFDLSPVGLSPSDRLDSKASGSDLDPSRLVQWLAGFEPGTQPLIVLDPPRPSSSADIPLQLVLRNHFAATLFASGLVPAALGTGLVKASELQAMVLATGIVREAPLMELHRALQAVVLLQTDPGRGDARWATTDWGDDSLEAITGTMFATPSALHISESEADEE